MITIDKRRLHGETKGNERCYDVGETVAGANAEK